MIRCPTCGMEWAPGTLTCPKDGTRLFERQSTRLPLETVLDDPHAGPIPARASPRGPTPAGLAIDSAPTTTDQPAVARMPMLNPPHDGRSGPKRALELPPEPKSGGRQRPAFKPPPSAPVQPIPSQGGPKGKNPWGDGEGSGTDPTSPRQQGLVGMTLGEYKVIEPLGQGGMGIVYRGEHPLIGKQVAIKVLKPELAADPKQVQRLKDEAKAVNAVRHPGLVDIFSFNQVPGTGEWYFVMELLEGQSLEEMLHARGKLKAWEAVPILEQALAALDAAHEAGVIHRDLKPSNIFLVDLPDHTFLVKLLDFGLAKIGGAPRGSTPQTTNVVVGTPEYMAPEQARAQEVSPRTDLYAMGIVAYELLTGDVPFSTESAVETLMMQLDMQPTPPGEREPSIPPAIEKLILRMIAKRPEDRPASAGEVKRELGRIKRALTNAETVVAELSSIRGIDETLPPGALTAMPAGPTPVNSPRPPEPTETKPSIRAVIVNPTSRFETTEQQLQPVVVSDTPPQRAPLEPRPATDRMMLAVTPSRRWLLPVAIVGALLIVATVWLVFFRDAGEPSVVPLPPPVVVKEPPRAVPADGVTTVSTPPAPIVKSGGEAPSATPAVKADPPRAPKPVPGPAKRLQHSKAEVRKRIAGLRERVKELPESQQHTAKQGLDAFETGLNPESSNPDEIWTSLDNFARTMFK